MQSFILTLGSDDTATAIGALAAVTLDRPGGGHLLRKGQRVGEAEVEALDAMASEAPGTRVSLIMPGVGDIGEDEAALLLGQALAGPGVSLQEPSRGRSRLVAAHRGLLLVDSARLAAANWVPDISIYSLFGGTSVTAGSVLAEAKITPLLTSRAHIERAVELLWETGDGRRGTGVVEVRAFVPHQAALLVRERLAADAAARLIESLRAKLAWFGSRLDQVAVLQLSAGRAEASTALRTLLESGAELLLTAGGSTSDPADPILCALEDVGAVMLRRGVPIHPGSLLWVASHGPALIVGVPSCGSFSEQTSLDLLLPRLLALGPSGLDGIEALAEGGLLTRGMEHRFPNYRSSAP